MTELSGRDLQAGLYPRHERESIRNRMGSEGQVITRIAELIEQEQKKTNDPYVLAAAVFGYLSHADPRRQVRQMLISQSRGKPICGFCSKRIFLQGVKDTSHMGFSIDHIVRLADGGKTVLENCRPAHRLCNSVGYHKKFSQLGSRTRKKLEKMYQEIERLEKKEELEELHGPVAQRQ